jgi:hypothetical protein
LAAGEQRIDLDIEHVLPADLTNTNYEVAVTLHCDPPEEAVVLRIKDMAWSSRGEHQIHFPGSGHGPEWIQHILLFSVPRAYAEVIADDRSMPLMRVRDEVVNLTSFATLDTARSSPSEVWVTLAIRNAGLQLVVLTNPSAVWRAQDRDKLRVTVTSKDRDVTVPVLPLPHEGFVEAMSYPLGTGPDVELCLSRMARIEEPGEYTVAIDLRMDVTPLPEYLESPEPMTYPSWFLNGHATTRFKLIRAIDGSVEILQ